MNQAAKLKLKFQQLYKSDARVYRAPGRVNLIGEHTDYNDGFVMPMAIELSTWVAIAPREDNRFVVYSENFDEIKNFDLSGKLLPPLNHWSDYVSGIVLSLATAGNKLRGANMYIRGEVPLGAGLSSSAALEVAVGYALLDSSDLPVDRIELARRCQHAENKYVGTQCGIMDQFISCNGQAGHSLLLDCRTLDYRMLPLSNDVRIVISNTMVRHELASGEYNKRRSECEEGVRHLARNLSGVRALRDVTLDELEAHAKDLPNEVYRRCRHVIGENTRTLEAAKALESGDVETFGKLMSDSHYSLRDDYEVSCNELDLMVELAGKVDGVFGSRMTGGGFGGCTVNMVKTECVEDFRQIITSDYEKATGITPEIYVCSAANRAGRVIE